MGSQRCLTALLLTAALLPSCRKQAPKPEPAIAQTKTTSATATSVTAVTAPISPATATVVANPAAPPTPTEQLRRKVESRKPVALDDAGKRTATAYLAALVRGRKATVAKDFAKAEAEFSTCLQLVPDDARAQGERGYARLLAGKLDDADKDFAAAAPRAPSTSLLTQLIHNRMLVAKQRGDEKAAKEFEAEKKRLKAARRVAPGIDCTSDASPTTLEPEHPKDLTEAWRLISESHANKANLKAAEITTGTNNLQPKGTEAELWQLLTEGPARDGAWAVVTHGNDGFSEQGHALFAKAGKLYLYLSLYDAYAARCGYSGGALLTVGGGGTAPWHYRLDRSEDGVGMMCEYSNNKFAPCGSVNDEDGNPVQSFCYWASSNAEVVVLDSKSFEGLLIVGADAQANEANSVLDPQQLLEVEWQPEQLIMSACGTKRAVPYNLGASPEPAQ